MLEAYLLERLLSSLAGTPTLLHPLTFLLLLACNLDSHPLPAFLFNITSTIAGTTMPQLHNPSEQYICYSAPTNILYVEMSCVVLKTSTKPTSAPAYRSSIDHQPTYPSELLDGHVNLSAWVRIG